MANHGIFGGCAWHGPWTISWASLRPMKPSSSWKLHELRVGAVCQSTGAIVSKRAER